MLVLRLYDIGGRVVMTTGLTAGTGDAARPLPGAAAAPILLLFSLVFVLLR